MRASMQYAAWVCVAGADTQTHTRTCTQVGRVSFGRSPPQQRTSARSRLGDALPLFTGHIQSVEPVIWMIAEILLY